MVALSLASIIFAEKLSVYLIVIILKLMDFYSVDNFIFFLTLVFSSFTKIGLSEVFLCINYACGS